MLKKFKSFASFKNAVLDFHYKGEDEIALRLVHDYVDVILTEHLHVSRISGSKVLDEICQIIGASSLKTLNIKTSKANNGYTVFYKRKITYVLTRVQKSGGLMKVIEDLVNAVPDASHILLATGIEGRPSSHDFTSRFGENCDIKIEYSPFRNYLKTLIWLQSRLVEEEADNNYLFNHHQDSVAVAAFQPGMLKKASFYHHGDHHICLGIHLGHVEHIDFHPMGYHICRDILNIDNKYIPLISKDEGYRSKALPFKQNGYLITATAAGSNKLEIPYYSSYEDLIPKLLSITNGKHVHIGSLSLWMIFKINMKLRQAGVPNNRFIYIPLVSSVWKALHQYKVDLYIASFPYGGAKTLIEVMGAGLPIALHKHIYSRVLSCIDIAYKDVFYWEDPKKLLHYCKNITLDDLEKSSHLSRKQYEKYHDPRILDGLLNHSKVIEAPPNVIKCFEENTDEVIFWMEKKISINHIIKRAVYRFMKRMRARFF